MLRILLCSALLAASPLAAQSADDPRPLQSGSRVRVFLDSGPAAGSAAVLVSGDIDTLNVVSPALGLARLPLADVRRLESAAPSRSALWTYALGIAGISGLAGAGAEAGGEEFVPAFMNTAIILSLAAGVAYALQGPPQRAASVDVSRSVPGGRVGPGPGALVRISTPAREGAVHRLQDFSADSLYLAADGGLTPLPRAQVTGLQVSLGRARRRGARAGLRIGAVAGGVLAGVGMASLGDFGLLMAPFGLVGGGLLGGGVGAAAGHIFAPPAWSEVPGFGGTAGRP